MPAEPSLRARAASGAVALVALAALLLANLPERTYGDDLFFVWCVVRDRVFLAHFLWLPLARGWTWALAHAGVDPLLALRALAALGAAAATVLLHGAARARGASRGEAVLFALLVLTAGSTWFFAVQAELHAVHLAAVALLARVLAGARPTSSPGRALAAALALGAVVGTHKSGALLLPGAVALWVVATPGRGARRRLADLGALAAGGAVALAVQAGVGLAYEGAAFGAHDDPGRYAAGLRERLAAGFGPADFGTYLGLDLVAPAAALAVLGAAGLGTLLRARPRLGLALLAVVVPPLAFFPLWNYEERGAYFLPLLPVLAGAALAAARADPRPPGRAGLAATVLLVQVAAVAAVLRPSEVLALLGPLGALALAGGALALGLLSPRRRALPRRAALRTAALLVLLQLLGSQRELDRWGAETPVLDWGRDCVAAAGGERSALVATGFERLMLANLLERPWRAPYAGTWAYLEALPRPGPAPFDVSLVRPEDLPRIDAMLADGWRVHVLETVFFHFTDHPTLGPVVRALAARAAPAPVVRGRFEARRLVPAG